MIKKLLALFLCIALLGVPVHADNEKIETESVQSKSDTSDSKVYILSLQDAIELARTNNPELNVCDIKMKSTEVSLDAARQSRSKSRKADVRVSMNLSTAYDKEGYYVEAYESAIRLGELEKKRVESKIAYNVAQKYFNYKLA